MLRSALTGVPREPMKGEPDDSCRQLLGGGACSGFLSTGFAHTGQVKPHIPSRPCGQESRRDTPDYTFPSHPGAENTAATLRPCPARLDVPASRLSPTPSPGCTPLPFPTPGCGANVTTIPNGLVVSGIRNRFQELSVSHTHTTNSLLFQFPQDFPGAALQLQGPCSAFGVESSWAPPTPNDTLANRKAYRTPAFPSGGPAGANMPLKSSRHALPLLPAPKPGHVCHVRWMGARKEAEGSGVTHAHIK